ncbi:putative bifunctional diguanylate cyclase/phosphodiesterase [Qipengyuania aquimaris]|uniref:putative bifunctional diguanylate cyclase/phosphodiesterase n=1 Tax=Qipengyuania aquimaris TaxID=255984 RepID=UPI0028F6C30E|nr:EAL domain-containing protein [Qipengyuania aquimaris]
MSEWNSDQSPEGTKPTVRQVIGLDLPETGDWARVHGRQYAVVSQRAGTRVVLHAIAALIVVWLCRDSIELLALQAWGAALGFAVMLAFASDYRLRDVEDRLFTERELRSHAMVSGLKGGIWSLGLCGAVFFGAGGQIASIWAAIAFLMLASVASRFSAPLSSVAFCTAASVGSLLAALATFNFGLAIIILASAFFASFGLIESARMTYESRLADLEMQEKSETVSMLLREFEEGQADWLWQIDTNRRLRSVSPRFAFALQRDAAEIEGKSFLQLISGDGWKNGQFPQSLHELADKLKGRESFSNFVVKATVRGEVRWWELSGTPMFDGDGQWLGFRGVGSDVTTQRESTEKIEYLARYDTLTQLPNRLQLNEALGKALTYAEQWRTRCAFLMIDLDRFKAVNDSLGHLVGDRLLAQVAARLKPLMDEGELVGRLGGDEFGVVIRDASDRRRADTLAKSIIAALTTPFHIDNHVLYVGTSVGSAIGPRDGRSVEELLRNADLALYRAKDEGGGNHFEYEPSLHTNAEERRQLEVALRSALENDEFVLHYQPVVDAIDESVVSFEALMRWNSPEHGFVSPAKFIPIAEDTRLIVPIGTWVLNQACHEAAANWPEDVKVNINVSPEQLVEPDFAGTVVRALSHSGLDPSRLEIEVTESIFMRDAAVARKALEQCMALGCSVALDDFGTGYSSLGYLRKLKFTTIKVDRLFVQGAAQDSPESLAIVRAVVAMADSLGMTTTAEGVENQDEADLIRRLGCTKIQGYHFGRPMPAEDARKVVKRRGFDEKRKSA